MRAGFARSIRQRSRWSGDNQMKKLLIAAMLTLSTPAAAQVKLAPPPTTEEVKAAAQKDLDKKIDIFLSAYKWTYVTTMLDPVWTRQARREVIPNDDPNGPPLIKNAVALAQSIMSKEFKAMEPQAVLTLLQNNMVTWCRQNDLLGTFRNGMTLRGWVYNGDKFLGTYQVNPADCQ